MKSAFQRGKLAREQGLLVVVHMWDNKDEIYSVLLPSQVLPSGRAVEEHRLDHLISLLYLEYEYMKMTGYT